MADRKHSGNMELGAWGESYAAKYLEDKGYEILSLNERTPYGEIDIIAEINHRLIFVEVKTRSTQNFGYPEEAITEEKIIHMVESAEVFLQEHPELTSDWQIDVIAIQVDSSRKTPVLTHFENALT